VPEWTWAAVNEALQIGTFVVLAYLVVHYLNLRCKVDGLASKVADVGHDVRGVKDDVLTLANKTQTVRIISMTVPEGGAPAGPVPAATPDEGGGS
jgi:hypothetical protein